MNVGSMSVRDYTYEVGGLHTSSMKMTNNRFSLKFYCPLEYPRVTAPTNAMLWNHVLHLFQGACF